MSQELQQTTDSDLVALIVDRSSEAASSELFRRYRKKIYLWCFSTMHDREEAVDCTQEIFIRIFRHLHKFDGRARFSTWVFRITRNYCLSMVSTRRDQWRRQFVRLDGIELEDSACSERMHQAELAGEVDALLADAGRTMKEDELEAFVLHYRDGLSVKEIGRTLGCTNATGARSLIQNARRKFRRLVERKE